MFDEYDQENEGTFINNKNTIVRYSGYSNFLNLVSNSLLTYVQKEIDKIKSVKLNRMQEPIISEKR